MSQDEEQDGPISGVPIVPMPDVLKPSKDQQWINRAGQVESKGGPITIKQNPLSPLSGGDTK